MRKLRIAVSASMMLVAMGGSAFAGGSSIQPYRDSYRPGDTVVLRGGASSGQYGWIEDGPFNAYLRVDPEAANAVSQHKFPNIHETDVYLGELEIRGVGPTEVRVSITFVLPTEIPDGTYEVVYCNEPCTQGLGDLIGGWVTVRAPRPVPLPGMAPIPVGLYLL